VSKKSLKIVALTTLTLIGGVALSACAVQQSNTYPVDIFTEMHYSPAQRSNEPTRLAPAGADLVMSLGSPEAVWNVPAENRRDYDIANARELYRINCSVCHGDGGLGDGAAAVYITAGDSYYASQNGVRYAAPPNLQESRQTLTAEGVYQIVLNGVQVMPAFEHLLSEEDIREIVDYVFDDQNGLGA